MTLILICFHTGLCGAAASAPQKENNVSNGLPNLLLWPADGLPCMNAYDEAFCWPLGGSELGPGG